jgi:hypothetical protein
VRPTSDPPDIELSVGPHPARPAWRILRIAYARNPEHDARITAALDAIFGPQHAPTTEPQAPPDDAA